MDQIGGMISSSCLHLKKKMLLSLKNFHRALENKFECHESESMRLNEVPKCRFGLTIFSRASLLPSSLWSKSQL